MSFQNPLDDDAYYLRAQLMYKTKDYKKAIADYSKAIELEPLSRYYKERAAAYDASGQHDLAKRDLAFAQQSL
jgi:tetratricopeptide (TPR) repeat protein